MFTVNRLTEIFRLTGLSINRTETDNMAAAPSVNIFLLFSFYVQRNIKYTIYKSVLISVITNIETKKRQRPSLLNHMRRSDVTSRQNNYFRFV